MAQNDVRSILLGGLCDVERGLRLDAANPMSISELLSASCEVDRVLLQLRNALWSEFQVSEMLRHATSSDPALRTSALLTCLHVETGLHAAAIRANLAAKRKGIETNADALKRMIDPSECRKLIGQLMPEIYDGKAEIIRSA